jgi:hypothetical protein
MTKLPHPFGYYYKSMMEGQCSLCHSDQIGISKYKEVIWCDGYLSGTYLTEEACDTYAGDGQGHCKYCAAGGFVNRHYPEDLVMVCESCRKAINFKTKKVSNTLF